MRPRPTALPLAALATALLLSACASTPRTLRQADRRLPLEPCAEGPLAGVALCGSYPVWEDRAAQSGRKIDLTVVVAPALTDHPAPDPVFYLMGGPGGGAAEVAAFGLGEFDLIRQHRDVVFIDQRGTGSSNRLACELPGSPEEPQGYFGEMMPVDAIKTCRRELEKKADLTLYTTPIGMDDIDEVRAWLGYDKINLFGGSYGTRAAQVYMRRHPGSVRTAILAGVTGFEQYLPLYHARDAKRGLDLLLADCAADEACHAAFPDIQQELQAVLARLDEAPAEVELPLPDGGTVTAELPKEIFVETARFMTYSPGSASALPLLIHQAYGGELAPFAQIGVSWLAQIRNLVSIGMYLSVTCAEDVPFFNAEEGEEAAAGTYLGDYRIHQQVRACSLWPRGQIPADFHQPLESDAPVLLLSGRLDPVTPPSWAEEVASHLPNGVHVLIHDAHHSTGGLTHPECLAQLMADFLERGSGDGLDTSCTADMRRQGFLTQPEQLAALMGGGGEDSED